MKFTAPEEVMRMRRLERLERLIFFMKSGKVAPATGRALSLHETHNLLMGFFQNSHWRTAWYCLRRALDNSWLEFSLTCQLFWYVRILRLNEEQIEERMGI
jgi:hypothetical protein